MIGGESIGQIVEMVNNTNPSMSLDDSYENISYEKKIK